MAGLLLASAFQFVEQVFGLAWLNNCERVEKLSKNRCWHQRYELYFEASKNEGPAGT
jgi:hypothetical protein